MKSMNRMKAIRRITTLVMLFIIIFCFVVTGFDMNVIINRGSQAVLFIKRMFPPDTGYCGKIIEPLIKTVQMSIAGTFIGAVFGLFTAFLYAGNLIKKPYVRIVVRVIVQCVRTIPVLILALVATFIWGLGAAAGTIAIAVSTWAVMARIGGEDIEGLTLKTYEAVTAIGAGRFKAFSRTVIIELLPGYLSNSLYVLEANIRHAAILGYVGAGGIGLLLNEKISWREYGRVGMILVMLFAAVFVIEGISTFLKAYLDGRIKRNITANVIISVCIMALFVYGLSAVKDVSTSKLGIKVVGAIMHGITHPDWGYMFMPGKSGVMYLMLETIAIAVAGTCAGAVFAAILTLINSRKFVPAPVAFIGRLIVMAIRTVPVYVYGLIFIRVTGPGSFAGVLTMMMCSIGLLTKRFTVAVDNWNMAAWNACKCAGTGFIARLRHVAVPELKFQFKDAVMYRLDVNVRSASTLGLVGAGGIGAPLIVYMNNYRWDAVGSILIVLFVVVLLIELLSKCLKRIH